MEPILNEVQLRQLASKMGQEWKAVATYLGVKNDEVYRLQADNSAVEDQIFGMLIKWRQRWDHGSDDRNGGPLDDLRSALVKAGRNDLAESLQGLTHGAYLSIADVCRSEFIRYYKDIMGVVPVLPWHHSEVRRITDIYVKLKLMELENKGGRIVHRDLNSYEEMLSLKYKDGEPVRYILLSGIAGSGKTTIASKIAYDWAQEVPESPLSRFKLLVALNVRELKSDLDLTEAIADQILPKDTQVNLDSLRKYLISHANEVLVVLDGADEFERDDSEMPREGKIIDVISNNRMRECTLVVTTRPHMVDKLYSLNSCFSRIETKGFSDAGVNEYIQRFFDENESVSDADFYQLLMAHESLHDLAISPMMLLLLCIVWSDSESQSLPETLTMLFKLSISFIMKRRLHKLGPSNIDDEKLIETQLRELVKALGKVALEGLLFPEQKLIFPASDFGDSKVVDEACAIGILTRETERSKLQSIQTVTFLHKTFQEAIAGFYLAGLVDSDHASFVCICEQVKEENAFGLEYVLRFCCGANDQAAGLLLSHVASIFTWEKPNIEVKRRRVQSFWGLETYPNWLKKNLWLLMHWEAQSEGLQTIALSLYKQGLAFNFDCTADERMSFEFLVRCASRSCIGESFLAKVRQVALHAVNADNAPVVINILRHGVNMTDVGLVLEKYNSSESQKQLGEALAQMACLEKISLSGSYMTKDQDLSNIFKHFAGSKRARFLQHFEVVSCGLDAFNLEKFFREPKLDLRRLRLVDNKLSEKVVKEVGVILGKALELEELDLSGNNISGGFLSLVMHLPKLKRLKVLRLEDTSLLANHMVDLVRDVILNLANLDILNLSCTHYSDSQRLVPPEALASVVEWLCRSSLRVLELKHVYQGRSGYQGAETDDSRGESQVAASANVPEETSQSLIEELDMSNNNFGKHTPRVIRLLKRMPSLKRLTMSNMRLTYFDALEFAEAIQSCQQLQELHIGDNISMGSGGIEALIRALPELPNLTYLSLSGLSDEDENPNQFVQKCLACGKFTVTFSSSVYFYEKEIHDVVNICQKESE